MRTLSRRKWIMLFVCFALCLLLGRKTMRKLIKFTVIAFAFLFMSSCSLTISEHGQYDPQNYVNNEWIARVGDSYSFMYRHGETSPTQTHLAFRGFYGKQSIWNLEIGHSGVLYTSMTVDQNLKGRFKVCLINLATAEVTILSETTGSVRKNIYLNAGSYTVMIVGHGAQGVLDMSMLLPYGAESVVVHNVF